MSVAVTQFYIRSPKEEEFHEISKSTGNTFPFPCHRPHLQLDTVLELNGTGTALQGGEGNVTVLQRRDVRVLAGTQSPGLILALLHYNGKVRVWEIVRGTTGGTVMLVRHPLPIRSDTLVDGEGLRTRGVKHQSNVGNVIGLAQIQGKIHVVRVLDALEHGLGLPPSRTMGIVEIGQEGGRMIIPPTDFATLFMGVTSLLTELDFILVTTGVGGVHGSVESCILEFGNATLQGRGRE